MRYMMFTPTKTFEESLNEEVARNRNGENFEKLTQEFGDDPLPPRSLLTDLNEVEIVTCDFVDNMPVIVFKYNGKEYNLGTIRDRDADYAYQIIKALLIDAFQPSSSEYAQTN